MKFYPRKAPKYEVPDGPHYVVAVDLGKRKVGVAVASVSGATQCLYPPVTVKCDYGPLAMAQAIYQEVHRTIPKECRDLPVVWVCEWPKKYKDKSKFHDDLDALFAVGHALRKLLPKKRWNEHYSPSDWKGNVPKPAHHRRLAKVLSDREAKAMPPMKEHDAWDAMGILLFALARTLRGGVLPRRSK